MRSDFCPSCFVDLTPGEKCSQCGGIQSLIAHPGDVLRVGYVLEKKYKVGRLLGRGGFGATYLAWDINLRVRVAIKEFLPRQLVARAPAGTEVHPYSGSERAFNIGLDQFLSEARNLAQFRDHPGIVSVLDFFPENGTGYLVMEYLDGSTLEQYAATAGRLDIPVALRLTMPVADALRACHAVGLIHRDVSPDNIFLTSDGRVKVLDFGAARFAVGSQSSHLSVILKEGYAPFEQYQQNGRQGPWTDIYALTATLYRLVTGRLPVSAADRVAGTPLLFPSKTGGKDPNKFRALLEGGLAIRSEQRFRTVDVFLSHVQAAMETYDPSPPPVRPTPPPIADLPPERELAANRSVLGQIGKYELRSVLARTAGGIVYDGWDSSTAQRVAVKAISLPEPEDNSARGERARLKDWMQAARVLIHPNIIRIHDYIDTHDSAYIVMEYVDGRTLQQMLDSREPFDLRSIYKLIHGILEGLHYSHSFGMVHGYINPMNVTVTADRKAMIRLTAARFGSGNIGQTRATIGSAAYMSPEQFVGEKIDRRSDIYSTGVVMYHLITGVCPYAGGLATITDQVLKSPVPRLHGKSPMAAAGLDQVVARAMAKKREQRFRSAAEFSSALQVVLVRPGLGYRSIVPPESERGLALWYTWGRKISQSRVVIACVIMVVAAAGGAFVWYWATAPGSALRPVAESDLDGKMPVRAELPGREADEPIEPIRNLPVATTHLGDQVTNAPKDDNGSGRVEPEGTEQTSPAPHRDKDVRGANATPSPALPPSSTAGPRSPSPRELPVDLNPAQPLPQPALPLSRTANSPATGAIPQSVARAPGGPLPGLEPSSGAADRTRPRNQTATRPPLETGSLEETMNRIRNENRLPVPHAPPDSPGTSTPETVLQPPPTFSRTSTSAIGLTCQTVTPDIAHQLGLDPPRGLRCIGVTVDSAAAKAGIRLDDVLLAVNRSELRDLSGLKTIARGISEGSTVRVEIFRDGRTLTVDLALDQLRQ
jgi:serine/threonine protein kinase